MLKNSNGGGNSKVKIMIITIAKRDKEYDDANRYNNDEKCKDPFSNSTCCAYVYWDSVQG